MTWVSPEAQCTRGCKEEAELIQNLSEGTNLLATKGGEGAGSGPTVHMDPVTKSRVALVTIWVLFSR